MILSEVLSHVDISEPLVISYTDISDPLLIKKDSTHIITSNGDFYEHHSELLSSDVDFITVSYEPTIPAYCMHITLKP